MHTAKLYILNKQREKGFLVVYAANFSSRICRNTQSIGWQSHQHFGEQRPAATHRDKGIRQCSVNKNMDQAGYA